MIHWSSHKTDTAHKYREEMNWMIAGSLAILALVALAIALIYTRKLMIPFVVALFIVALVSPIEDFQVKRLRLPRVIAVIVTLLIVLAFMALVSIFLVQAGRTIAYTANDYSESFANMANKLLKPLADVYKLETPPPVVVPEIPPPVLGATPGTSGSIESQPEAYALFPLVTKPDKAAVLDVRPQSSRATSAKGAEKSAAAKTPPQPNPLVLTNEPDKPAPAAVPSAPSASAKDAEKPAAVKAPPQPGPPASTKESDKPVAAAVPAAPSMSPKDANVAAVAAGEPNEAAKNRWRIDTQQIAENLIVNARQIMQDMANHMFAMLRNTVTAIFGLLSGTLFVFFFVIFLLAGRNPYAEHSQMYVEVVQKIRRYLATKVVISAAVGVLVWASLAILHMELAGVFGILAFLLNFIPVIGPIIVTVLPIPLAVAQFQSTLPVILVVVIPGTIHNVIGNIIEPKMMGEGLDLHPVTILLALSFWGMLWGIVGTFLAVPITAAIRIVLMQFDTFRPIGDLLAGEFSHRPAPAPAGVQRDRQAEPVVTTASASTPPEGTVPAGSPRG